MTNTKLLPGVFLPPLVLDSSGLLCSNWSHTHGTTPRGLVARSLSVELWSVWTRSDPLSASAAASTAARQRSGWSWQPQTQSGEQRFSIPSGDVCASQQHTLPRRPRHKAPVREDVAVAVVLACMCVYGCTDSVVLYLVYTLTHKMFKRMLFITTKHNTQILGVIPFIKLQNDT